MKREEKGQVKVGVGIELLWGAFVNDMSSLLPIVMPTLVTEGKMLKGNGGLGTVYHLKFGPSVTQMRYQKEEVVEFDETLHRIGLQVTEGGRLNTGYTYYLNTFQFTAVGESETLVDATVDCETGGEEINVPSGGLVKSAIASIQYFETYLLKQGSSSSQS